MYFVIDSLIAAVPSPTQMEKAKKLASDAGVPLNFIKSVRWDGVMSEYQPKNKDNFFTREFSSDYGGSPY